ncbi:MAG: ABC transporter ATP-binding protein [Oscillospiraceae bacterium]|nr:ABC transporter ATP-binding protein [Oscillospiraceae bacterium]
MLEVNDLHIHFHGRDHDSVSGVSFSIRSGEIVGLVGESGCGKTITSMAICGLLSRKLASCTGSVKLDGREILNMPRADMRQLQGSAISVVFQEPMSSMDPCMRIGPQVEEALTLHTELSAEERREKALKAMDDAELPEPAVIYDKYPHEMSGGMLQRAMIAAAIINEPDLLICDEPTTALDVTIQAQILKLLQKINRERGTTILFISHNMNVVKKLCSRVLVMRKGTLVEEGTVNEIFYHPRKEYTQDLIAAIPTRERKIRDILRAEKEKTDDG